MNAQHTTTDAAKTPAADEAPARAPLTGRARARLIAALWMHGRAI